MANCSEAERRGFLPEELKKRLTPQQINHQDRDIPTLQGDEWKLCRQYIEFLLWKKQIIQTTTKFNIKTIIEYFSENLKSRKLAPDKYSGLNEWDLEAIIFYINYTTYHLNENIRTWSKPWHDETITPLGEPEFMPAQVGVAEAIQRHMHVSSKSKWDTPYFKYAEGRPEGYLNVCRSFLSLKTIIESKYLLELSSHLLIYYLNFPGPLQPHNLSLTEKILDKIVAEMKKEPPKATSNDGTQCDNPLMLPAKIKFVNSTNNKDFSKLVRVEMLAPLNQFRKSELGFPDGIRIVLNIISPNEVKTEVPADTLSSLFEQLSVDPHYIDVEEELPPSASARLTRTAAAASATSSAAERKGRSRKEGEAPRRGRSAERGRPDERKARSRSRSSDKDEEWREWDGGSKKTIRRKTRKYKKSGKRMTRKSRKYKKSGKKTTRKSRKYKKSGKKTRKHRDLIKLQKKLRN